MIEALWRSYKFQRHLDDIVGRRLLGISTISLEGLHNNALDASDFDEVEADRPAASCIDAIGAVLVDESHELLSLAQIGPGEVATEKLRW